MNLEFKRIKYEVVYLPAKKKFELFDKLEAQERLSHILRDGFERRRKMQIAQGSR